MTDSTTPPPPGEPGWWRTDDEPTQPYAAPPGPRHGGRPDQPPVSTPPQPGAWPQPPDSWPYGQPEGYPSHPQQPYPGQYPDEPTVAYPTYGQQPGYIPGGRSPYPPQFGGPGGPQYPAEVPGQFPPGPPPRQPRKRRKGWLLGGIAALLVALVGGGAVVATNWNHDKVETAVDSTPSATGSETEAPTVPVPTDTFTDGLSSSSPTSTPTPKERRRTLRDVDAGLPIFDDVYVKPAKGWEKEYKSRYSITLGATGKGYFSALVETVGYEAKTVVPEFARGFIQVNKVYAVKMTAARKVKAANSNISSQAQVSFTGRLKVSGATYSVSGRCTTMTGVESIHNVTVSTCALGRKDVAATITFRDAAKMTSSIARSI